jgi:hypothetical protein
MYPTDVYATASDHANSPLLPRSPAARASATRPRAFAQSAPVYLPQTSRMARNDEAFRTSPWTVVCQGLALPGVYCPQGWHRRTYRYRTGLYCPQDRAGTDVPTGRTITFGRCMSRAPASGTRLSGPAGSCRVSRACGAARWPVNGQRWGRARSCVQQRTRGRVTPRLHAHHTAQ